MKVTGQKELLKALKKLGGKADKVIEQAVFLTANDVRNDAVSSLNTVSGGNLVTRYSQGGKAYQHVAAAEGQSPNTDTGRLVQSVAVEQSDSKTSYVGTNVEYGKYLEVGTKNMGARPWLLPALQSVKAKGGIVSYVKRLVKLELAK